jgi:hypothetical protein
LIEGLRATPWFLEQKRRVDLGIADCTACKQRTTQIERQYLGCGYEPRGELVQVRPWQPPSGKAGFSGPDLETCAGYTTSLPEVREASLARVHWDTGNLSTWCGSDAASEDLLNAIVIIVGASNDVQRWCMTPSAEGGGGS